MRYVTKNIEDIQVGDWVYSYNSQTGEMELKEVTAVFVREIDHINYLTVIDESGEEQVLAATDSHPFWVVTDDPDLERAASGYADGMYHENIDPGLNGFWVEAKDLREGDVFIGANGELSTLVSKERVEFAEPIMVYNFTVEGNHNYFVIAVEDENGQTCILVHNAEYTPSWYQNWWWQDWNNPNATPPSQPDWLSLFQGLTPGFIKDLVNWGSYELFSNFLKKWLPDFLEDTLNNPGNNNPAPQPDRQPPVFPWLPVDIPWIKIFEKRW